MAIRTCSHRRVRTNGSRRCERRGKERGTSIARVLQRQIVASNACL
jgi:hypothetical protein